VNVGRGAEHQIFGDIVIVLIDRYTCQVEPLFLVSCPLSVSTWQLLAFRIRDFLHTVHL